MVRVPSAAQRLPVRAYHRHADPRVEALDRLTDDFLLYRRFLDRERVLSGPGGGKLDGIVDVGRNGDREGWLRGLTP
jgi:hypothetical protein